MTIEKIDEAFGFVINCDFCPDYFEVDTEHFSEVTQALRDKEWKYFKDENGEWAHKCPVCQEGKMSEIKKLNLKEAIANFTEIKEILERQSFKGANIQDWANPECNIGMPRPQPDEELVEEIITAVDFVKSLDGEDAEYLRKQLYKLLQSRQPEKLFNCGCGNMEEERFLMPASVDPNSEAVCRSCQIDILKKSRQPKLFSELAKIIEWLYMSEKVQLAQSDITKIVNRLEAIEKLLQPRQGSKDELALIENLADIDWLTQEDMMCLESIRRKLGGEDE